MKTIDVTAHKRREREKTELFLLLEGIYRYYGYDFRDYVPDYIMRRVLDQMKYLGVGSITALTERILHDSACLSHFLDSLSTHVTSMFRDVEFFATLRKVITEKFRNQSFIRIWHAGCSSGEEVYSLAIVLRELDVLKKSRIYATDMNESILEKAKSGLYQLDAIQSYTKNYIASGGIEDFSSYYQSNYGNAIIDAELKKQVVFSKHNLVTDGSFNEFNIIVCRNVLIYFNKNLQTRVLNLIYESLALGGILCLGQGESIQFTTQEACYRTVDDGARIYLKQR